MTLASIKSLGSGIGGAVVLSLFAATFLTLEKVVFIMPVFLAFTGAMIGFQLVDTLRGKIRGRFLFPFVMGTGQGAAVFALVNITGPLAGRMLTLTVGDLAVYIVVSGITSYLGARLAARYFNL
ncbi:MAG: hypothetical protein MI863_21895 [Desulfobacterales bacterium]|nr:hypothetical protein [Desulfobacterales bacterium]